MLRITIGGGVLQMRGRKESGVTLVEVLMVIAVLGIVTVPLFAAFTDAYQRTIRQGNETQLLHYAASIMEDVKTRPDPASADGETGECRNGTCSPTANPSHDVPTYDVDVSTYMGYAQLYEIAVQVYPASTDARRMPVRLVTVVRR